MALAEGISIHQYIDGWLMRMNSKQQCQENTYWLVHLDESLGLITNFLKSDLFQTPVIEFIGYFDLKLVFSIQRKSIFLER